ncbi:MAG: Spy/CpxP family protein refolding chaperone [Acidobacteriota bacterium]|nr:Spy/CpxP family protein refolding chaperone [Acidobacteriota bacterium]
MKFRIAHTLATGVLAAGLILAQGPQAPNGHGGAPPDPATMVAHQVDRLTTLLTLTDAQKQQATTIFTNAAAAETPIRTNLQTAHASLTAAVQKNDTASIDNLAAQIGSLTGQQVGVESKAQAAFFVLLSADQKAKYLAAHGPNGMRHGPAGARFGGPRQ